MMIAVLVFAANASSASTIREVHRLIDELHYTVDRVNPSTQDLAKLANNLRAEIEFLRNPSPRLLCMKADNGRHYPSQPTNGQIVGDSAYNAGHVQIADCKATLKVGSSGLVCFKRDNGRYYPTDSTTGLVVGSTAYNAGYVQLEICLESI